MLVEGVHGGGGMSGCLWLVVVVVVVVADFEVALKREGGRKEIRTPVCCGSSLLS
jgi:hypothetical protein